MTSSPAATPFSTILDRHTSRRALLRHAALGAGAIAASSALPFSALAKSSLVSGTALSSLTFPEVTRGLSENHVLAEGYQAQVLLRWGDPLFDDAPPFDPASPTPEGQAKQFGYNNDHIQFFPIAGNLQHGLLCVNHEFSVVELAFTGGRLPEDLTRIEHLTDMQMHGASVVELRRSGNQWTPVMGRFNRRITASTPMELCGPAAGHPRVKTSADPTGTKVLGTFANCAGGKTPWGTYLTCEENIDMFFHLGGYDGPELAHHKKMLIGEQLFHRWDMVDGRFDVTTEPHEPNRFGWVVEIDPFNPDSIPKKRTALGRFKHESATCTLNADGRVVVYTGDDEVFQYIYRYVSDKPYLAGNHTHNQTLLDEGTLYVARFDDAGLTWLPLIYGQNGLDASHGFDSQGEILIETRRAADIVGATPMDRCEDIEVSPVTGRVYASLSKNYKRETTDAANRRAPDPMGYVLEIIPPCNPQGHVDHAAIHAGWDILLEGGNPSENDELKGKYGPKVSANGWLCCPDNLAFDVKGRLWIATDGQFDALGCADGLYATDVMGAGRAITRAFFRGPVGCEVTGPCFAPDSKTLFVSVQHPAQGSTFENPSTRWPDFDPKLPPRPAILAITKHDGGIIGG